MSIVQPRLTVLDPEQIDRVHRDSLRILWSTGVRVDDTRARDLLARAAGPGALDGDRVRIPAELVDWALAVAPRQVEVYNRRGGILELQLCGRGWINQFSRQRGSRFCFCRQAFGKRLNRSRLRGQSSGL